VLRPTGRRPTLATIEEAGFNVSSLERTQLPKTPSFVRPSIVGTASPRAV
jgi:hypothetical protein